MLVQSLAKAMHIARDLNTSLACMKHTCTCTCKSETYTEKERKNSEKKTGMKK